MNRQKHNLNFKVKFHKTINFPSKYSSHINTSSIININGLLKARDLCFGGDILRTILQICTEVYEPNFLYR